MTNLLIDDAVVRQALEATEYYLDGRDPTEFGCACEPDTFITQGSKCGPCIEFDKQAPVKKAITALRNAIEQQEKVEPPFIPVMYIHPVDIGRYATGTVQRVSDEQMPLFLHPAPAVEKVEPVGMVKRNPSGQVFISWVGDQSVAMLNLIDKPLYTHPAPAVPDAGSTAPANPGFVSGGYKELGDFRPLQYEHPAPAVEKVVYQCPRCSTAMEVDHSAKPAPADVVAEVEDEEDE